MQFLYSAYKVKEGAEKVMRSYTVVATMPKKIAYGVTGLAGCIGMILLLEGNIIWSNHEVSQLIRQSMRDREEEEGKKSGATLVRIPTWFKAPKFVYPDFCSPNYVAAANRLRQQYYLLMQYVTAQNPGVLRKFGSWLARKVASLRGGPIRELEDVDDSNVPGSPLVQKPKPIRQSQEEIYSMLSEKLEQLYRCWTYHNVKLPDNFHLVHLLSYCGAIDLLQYMHYQLSTQCPKAAHTVFRLKDSMGRNSASYAVFGGQGELYDWLNTYRPAVVHLAVANSSLLHYAAASGNLKMFKSILKEYYDDNAEHQRSKTHATLLHYASTAETPDIFLYLAEERGLDVFAETSGGWTVWNYAHWKNDTVIKRVWDQRMKEKKAAAKIQKSSKSTGKERSAMHRHHHTSDDSEPEHHQ